MDKIGLACTRYAKKELIMMNILTESVSYINLLPKIHVFFFLLNFITRRLSGHISWMNCQCNTDAECGYISCID